MSGNKEDTLRHFCDVTGADENRSRFFLESSNWQLEVALSSFYEHGGHIEEAPSASPAVGGVQPMSDSDMDSPPRSPVQAKKKDKKKSNPHFATLDSLQQESSSEDEEISVCGRNNSVRVEIVQEFFCHPPSCSKKKEDCDKCNSQRDQLNEMLEEIQRLNNEINRLLVENLELSKEISQMRENSAQAFYAGGSERSGQQILGPGKGRKDIITEMFKSVREQGAVVFDEEQSSTSRGRSGLFGGVGYRLGQTTDDHEQVTPGSAAQQQEGPRVVRLRLYRAGFVVDDGPLRLYSDPEHAHFLSCIRRGTIPPELRGHGEVKLSLEDKRHEECPRPASKHMPFGGKGHMLGSPTPPTVGATCPVAASGGDREANMRAAQNDVQLDDTAPVTSVQFRLADGSRLTGRFNHSHTVADLARFVARAEPTYQLTSFALLAAFPRVELDESQTLAQADLLNATVLQRLK